MTSDEVNAYINRPWVGGGRGPDSFDCWGLLAWVQREHFGIHLPERVTDPAGMRAIYHDELESGRWRIVPRPVHGCGVLLRSGDRPHVGVYLQIDGGGVLHAMEGVGVIYTSRHQLTVMGYPRATWYEFLPRDSHSHA
ncbi:NlpC/P60 family protein [Paraburkholderia guartelaensis]|uniref:NlpC/P60 family protein n=1 Tax=Paraburkholderia guartelaensis TaxID=2546446 RepID=A0ABU9SEQ2_9BURK